MSGLTVISPGETFTYNPWLNLAWELWCWWTAQWRRDERRHCLPVTV